MLAKRRTLHLKNGARLETPLLLPSFSSKTFQDEKVSKIVEYASGTITDEILVSIYDLHYGYLRSTQLTFASAIFLDSGGFEASEDVDLSDSGKKPHKPRPWKIKQFHETLRDRWDFKKPTVLVSYDAPRAKRSVERQIERGRATFARYPEANSTLLLKTESNREPYLNMNAIIASRHKLADFDVIGVTEKELGQSTLERMLNIARLRVALNAADINPPIHVFGSLDTVSTPLYFFAGADIFDGLTWLRYAFHEGKTIYKHNYGSMELGIEFEDFRVNGKVWNDNYFYMRKLKRDMARFLLKNDFGQFQYNGDLFKSIVTQFEEKREQRG
jgi:hypothetical protein